MRILTSPVGTRSARPTVTSPSAVRIVAIATALTDGRVLTVTHPLDVEADVIATLKPPFNLTHCRTRYTDDIKRKRTECAELARQWAVERGLQPGSSRWADPPVP